MFFAQKTKQSAKFACYITNNAKEESKTKKLLTAAEKQFCKKDWSVYSNNYSHLPIHRYSCLC